MMTTKATILLFDFSEPRDKRTRVRVSEFKVLELLREMRGGVLLDAHYFKMLLEAALNYRREHDLPPFNNNIQGRVLEARVLGSDPGGAFEDLREELAR